MEKITTFLWFDDVGSAIPVNVSVLPQARRLAIDLVGEGIDFHAVRQALAPADLGSHCAAGRLPLALDGTRLDVLADHLAITIAERGLSLGARRSGRRGPA